MIILDDILDKIKELEHEIVDISNILSLEFFTDGSGSIHSNEAEYFCFENIKDLKQFVKLDNDYIIRNRRKYPI